MANEEQLARKREMNRLWRLANKERIKGTNRTWYLANREKKLAQNRAWYDANPELAKATKRARRLANIERVRYLANEWRRTHLISARVQIHRYRARKRAAEGKFTVADIKAIYEKQGGRCAACGISILAVFHIDHVIPLVRGGSNWPSNLQLLCQPCNDSKGSKTMEEWRRAA